MLITALKAARRRTGRQDGFTLVELLVVIGILGILAAIVLFNISGVQASAACNAMKTDGGTLQNAADIYYNNTGKYPVTGGDTATPAGASVVNVAEITGANLLHQAPPADRSIHLQRRSERHRPRTAGPGRCDLPIQLTTIR